MWGDLDDVPHGLYGGQVLVRAAHRVVIVQGRRLGAGYIPSLIASFDKCVGVKTKYS